MTGRRSYYYRSVSELAGLLGSLVSSYRYLVGGADEFNRITLADKDDVEDAIERADELGDIVDKLIKELEHQVENYLCEIKQQYPGGCIPVDDDQDDYRQTRQIDRESED